MWGILLDRLSEHKVAIVLCVVGILVLIFIALYVVRAIKIKGSLKKAHDCLETFGGDKTDKRAMERNFQHADHLLHCWREYAETLHPQKETVDGEKKTARLRSTVPADAFFNASSIVDTALGADFFKHLPGILTGIGIIGTFFGLISGLQGFDAGGSVEHLRDKLKTLLDGVRDAFLASTGAIVAAIVVTFVEKLLLNLCYQELDRLVKKIDGLYEAGAGEEYLQRLADSSEQSSDQTKQLKDSLVGDLKDLLTNLSSSIALAFENSIARHTDRQIESHQKKQDELSTAISSAISESIKTPVEEMSRVAKNLGGSQGEAINDLLSAMMEKMEGTFGGQMKGLGDLMTANAAAMQNVQAQFGTLIEQLAATGQSTTAAVAAQMQALMNDAEQRQQRMNDAILSILDQIRGSIRESEEESAKKLADAMAGIGETVGALMQDLARQRQAMGEAEKTSMDELQAGLADLVAEMRRSATETSSMYGDEFRILMAEVASGQKTLSTEMAAQLEAMKQRTEELDNTRREDEARRQEQLSSETHQLVASLTSSMNNVTAQVTALFDDVAHKRNAMDQVGNEAMGRLHSDFAEFIKETRKSATDTSNLFGEKLKNLLEESVRGQQVFNDEASQQLQRIRKAMEETDNRRLENESAHRERFIQTVNAVIDRLATDTRNLANVVNESVSAIRSSVSKLEMVTVTGSDALARGADSVQKAALDMMDAGNDTAKTLTQFGNIHEQIASTSTVMIDATNRLREVVNGYMQQRGQIDALVGTLQTLVRDTEGRVGVSRSLVADMERLVANVKELQTEANVYLGQVTGVLHKGFNDFSEAVGSSLRKERGNFDTDLGKAVGMFSRQVSDLDGVLDRLIGTINSRVGR